ncbi:DUF397 domain-containing protein [Catenuloplanes japonicus]|uniref:DUF397 domain-containing protein n=1 Tax=Catenuloplanes japonicus TaxID=33876 RepID=UPI0005248E59|nr:DUF397 domain-containing protein [Catenuloplanes japonicus]
MKAGQTTPWITSTRSGSNGGQCVETRCHNGGVEVRDSKAGAFGPVLRFTEDSWTAFLGAAAAKISRQP